MYTIVCLYRQSKNEAYFWDSSSWKFQEIPTLYTKEQIKDELDKALSCLYIYNFFDPVIKKVDIVITGL